MSAKFALVIGNTEYTDPGLAQLTAPGKDAEDFGRILKDPNLCAFDDVKVLLNQPEHIVRRAIEVYFDQRKPSDLVLFYFSGHGIRDEMGALYLAVKNTVRSRLRSTAIKSDYIREIMDQSRSKRQVLILDCCNSGAFAQGTKAATGVSIGTASAFEGTGYGRVVLTASDSTQFAWEGDKVIGDTDNSLFTHFLVKGLEGDADLDCDGRITIDELYDYAYEQIVNCTPKQTPGKWSYKQQGEIVLRQSAEIDKIKPTRLPADLLSATESTLPYVREGAVKQLGDMLSGKNIAMAQAARLMLEKIVSEDDSRHVSLAAKKALDAVGQASEREINQDQGTVKDFDKPSAGQLPAMRIENTDGLPQKPEVIPIAHPNEQPNKRVTPVVPPTPTKDSKYTGKRPIIVWTIVFLSSSLLLMYAASKLLKPPPSEPTRTTTPPVFMTPTFMVTSTPSNTDIPTNLPTTAPIVHTVIVTVPPVSTQSILDDPIDFVYFYFDNINNRNYDLTWSLLSDQYKARTNPDGKQQYIEFWSDYDKVVITSAQYKTITTIYVQVNLNAVFYKGGSTTSSELTYFLSRNESQPTWLFDVVPDEMCSSSPRQLNVGTKAKVTTAKIPLLLRRTASRGSDKLEDLYPGTIVSVIGGPECNAYKSAYFWYWEVRSPSGMTGWIVEGSDSDDPVFIQPVH